ncbi:EAL domain-containing protein [Sneathiella litorea]|uniref:EAL domain-containing protein n=1 Tax=Sneathiella litorea TaxID=2606216 RepID=A0A6L8W448_9PROT|nr:EAL domain-containing protein [Sneathiella litorea]
MLYHSVIIIAYALTAVVIAVQTPVYVQGIEPVAGYWAGGVFFLLCALVHDFIMRHVERSRFQRDLLKMRSDLDMAESGLDRFDNILGRLAGKDGNMESFAAEMQILRKLLKQLSSDPAPEKKEEEEIILSVDEEVPEELDDAVETAADPREEAPPRDDAILEIVRAGLQENKVDLYLQPIVRLPQRRTLFYEAFSRIRGPRGEVITPGQYLAVAESAGLIGTIDNLLLIRCVQLIRRVRQRNADIGFFVNVSARTLNDTAFFRQFVEFLDQNKDLSESLILEFAQDDIENASEVIQKGLATLAKMGFSFSVDHVQRLDFDFGELGDRHFRYLKVAAGELLPGRPGLPMDIHPDDLREALLRENIELIASMVEDEDTVIGLLDVEVGFGQGFLFGVPRPPQSVN